MQDPRDGSLARLQRFVTEAVLGAAAANADPERSRDADHWLAPGGRALAPADRLEIYRDQYWLRHVGNLVDDFPTLEWIVGARAFRALASRYLTAHPPRTWNLQRLGADLPAYFETDSQWGGDRLAVDAGRLDWAFMEAFDAPDAGPLDLSPLVGAPEGAVTRARLTFRPSIRRLALEHPAHELREAVKRGDARERPTARGVRVVVWRDAAFALRVTEVDPTAFELLAELSAGTSLGPACEALARASGAPDDLSERVGAWFQQWTANGWVSEIHLAR
jgi:hypothetical protein